MDFYTLAYVESQAVIGSNLGLYYNCSCSVSIAHFGSTSIAKWFY